MNTSMYKPEGFSIGNTDNRECFYSQSALEKAAATGKILEAQAILCDSEMALTVDLGCIKGKIPKEEVVYNISGEEVKDIAVITRVGKTVCFKILALKSKTEKRLPSFPAAPPKKTAWKISS